MNHHVPEIWNGKESQVNIAGANIPVDDFTEYKLVWNDEFDLDHLDLRKYDIMCSNLATKTARMVT